MTGHERLRGELGAIEGETDDKLAARGAVMIVVQRDHIQRLRRAIGRAVDPLYAILHATADVYDEDDVDDGSLE